MKKKRFKNLKKEYLLLVFLAIIIILLIILLIKITYTKYVSEEGLPSVSLWKPLDEISKITNASSNESLIEKNKKIENPSATETFKELFKNYWMSYLILIFIVILVIAWILIVLQIYDG